MDFNQSVNIILFFIVAVLILLVLGMWFVLNARIKSANEQVMNTSTHIDEQVQLLANHTSATYAPIASVQDIASNVSDINKTFTEKTEDLKNKLISTNEESQQKYLRGLSQVNNYSQDYATKAISSASDLDKRMLDVENNNNSWQQTQTRLYSDFLKKQNSLMDNYQKTADKVFTTEQDILKENREIKNVMHIVSDETSILNDFTIKTRSDLEKRIATYTRKLNNLYNTNLNRVVDHMNRNEILMNTNINKLNSDLRNENDNLKKQQSDIKKVQGIQDDTMKQHKILMNKYQNTSEEVLKTEINVIKESNDAKKLMNTVHEDVKNLMNKVTQETVRTKHVLEENISSSVNAVNRLQNAKLDKLDINMRNEINTLNSNIQRTDRDLKNLQAEGIKMHNELVKQQNALIDNMKNSTDAKLKENDIAIKS